MQNLGFRFLVIAIVVGFLGYMCYRGVNGGLELGIDLKGGSEIQCEFDFSDIEAGQRAELLKQAIGIIQQRIDFYGLKDISIQPVGDHRFTVQVSATDKENVDAIKGLITVLGHLEFRITVEPDTPNFNAYWQRLKKGFDEGKAFSELRNVRAEDRVPDDVDSGRYPLGLRWYRLSDKGKTSYPAKRRPEGKEPYVLCQVDDQNITGEALRNATYRRNQQGFGGDFVVVFDVKKLYQGAMGGLTKNVGDHMAIILNQNVDSAPVLQSTLTASGQISGGFDEKEAKALAAVLKAGALREKPKIIAERTVASDLAGTAKDRGILSIVIGFVGVLVLMVWLYMGPGLLANLALLLNVVIVVGVLNWFGAVLTLPGLAGLVLTVGMAVDANILVFERIKEEKAKGRTVSQAIATGYDRALVTIIDANLTTLITAYMLFQIGSGPVRGFGITLAVGIIASMFTALYVTRTVFALLLVKGKVTEAKMRGEFSPPSIGWTAMMGPAVTASAIAMLAGFVVYDIVPDKKKYDLDFTQGAKLIMRFHEEVELDELRGRLNAMGDKDPRHKDINVRVSARGIGTQVVSTRGNGFELRTQEIGSDEEVEGLVAALRKEFADWLLPGPFEDTIEGIGGGRSVGTIYFLSEGIQAPWVEQALLQSGQFPGAKVEKLDPVPGAGSVFRITVQDLPENRGPIAINLRSALSKFSLEDARAKLLADSKNDELTTSQQKAASAAFEALKTMQEDDKRGAEFFAEADPFPLADRIDPSTAREHRDAAVKAVALAIVGIIMYVAFRFRSWAYGFAAVIALIHDVLVVMGVVAVVNYLGLVDARLNLVTVAAFLTLIGYSINDSIVVFDRIRENRGSGRSRMSETIDKSLNQTLSRTIRTTGTTWIVVVLLLVMNFGANSTLEGFAFILMLGVLVGTYSSIFIASPTLLYLPWLWERTGGTIKSFSLRCLPWVVAAAVALLAIDAARGIFTPTDDPSRLIFNDIVLAVPIGVLVMFLVNFVRFANRKKPETTAA